MKHGSQHARSCIRLMLSCELASGNRDMQHNHPGSHADHTRRVQPLASKPTRISNATVYAYMVIQKTPLEVLYNGSTWLDVERPTKTTAPSRDLEKIQRTSISTWTVCHDFPVQGLQGVE